MKRFLIWFYFVFLFAACSVVAESFEFSELQAFTNTITKASSMSAWCSGINGLPIYLEILTKAKTDENVLPKDLAYAKEYTNIYKNAKILDDEAPATAIPRLIALLENDNLTDLRISFYGNKITNTFGEWIYQRLNRKLNIKLPIDRQSIFLQWLPEKTLLLRPKTLVFFWYYCGLKYLPVLMEDWYTCWKLENAKSEPRKEVLDKLAKEAARFNYHIFSFLAEKIENGDSTLLPVVKKMRRDGGYRCLKLFGTPNFENYQIDDKLKAEYTVNDEDYFDSEEEFLNFWKENKTRFTIKSPEKTLPEIKHIFTRKNRPNEMAPAIFLSAIEAEKALAAYCAQKERPISNCWYFAINDEDVNKNE